MTLSKRDNFDAVQYTVFQDLIKVNLSLAEVDDGYKESSSTFLFGFQKSVIKLKNAVKKI
jgi:hypothetical protein